MPTVSPDAIASPPPYLARGVVDQSDDGELSPFAKLLGEQTTGTPAATTDKATAADPSQYSMTTQPPATAAQKPAGPSRADNAPKVPMGGRGGAAKQSTTSTAAATAPSDPVAQTVTAAEAADASAVSDSALPVISAGAAGGRGDAAGTAAPNGNGQDSRARVSKAQAANDQPSIGQILNSQSPNAQAPNGQALAGKTSSGQSAISEVAAGADLKSLVPMAPASIGQQQDAAGSNPTAPQAGVPGAAAPINLASANADNSGSSNSGSGAIAALRAAAITIPATGTIPAPVTAGMAGAANSAAAGDGGAKTVQNSRSTQRAIAFSEDPPVSMAASQSGTASPTISANPDEGAGSGGAPAGDVANAATQPGSLSPALHTLRDPADADHASADRAGTGASTGLAAALAGNDGETADAGQQDLAVPANAALGAAVPATALLTPTPSVATRAADATGTADAPAASAGANDPNAAGAAVPVANIGVTIAAQANAGNTRFEIRLEPPDLGRVDVQLSVDTSGTVSSRLIVERPDTLDLLRRDAPQLERTLRDAGLDTGGGLQFALADQGFASRNWYVPHNDYGAAMPGGSMAEDTSAGSAGYAASSGRGSGLDITV